MNGLVDARFPQIFDSLLLGKNSPPLIKLFREKRLFEIGGGRKNFPPQGKKNNGCKIKFLQMEILESVI